MSRSSIKSKLAMAQALAVFMDSGALSATIVFYEGVQPATPETTTNPSNALVTCTFPEPCIKETTPNYVELHPTDTATVIKTGTATWARIYNGAGEVAADLAVGTDMALANTNLVVGGTLSIQSIKLRP
ncbi:hypothetical protein QUG64_06560 [Acinetobacter lwoffii]|uniref:Uncharacterized protein n=1 Tax=Acinetobacter lwoffii NCTC 5866 = CIP 64.10 = NIPH 512 TaxID=981327 RepID=A0ABP2ZJF9_ACILW|nr:MULTISPECIES: hypothetical protein [Acinetobacter]ENU16293.1 hypothetical protein F995_01769 [Acinetobacter sp. CIP A162]ESJ95650.1 hypothetical protein P800_00464 [Acinetobacter lwoffii NCTC 5866 = CIP 64.10 = NIPH 512]QXB40802.1 hypothetical protein I6L23_01805 [Acinetobacter lwoffii]SUU31493.1 Uncharacterised protein [Acinetobacter lwoffii]VFQ37688.1 Uncharacterised protein [Acinetobacter lwoffii]